MISVSDGENVVNYFKYLNKWLWKYLEWYFKTLLIFKIHAVVSTLTFLVSFMTKSSDNRNSKSGFKLMSVYSGLKLTVSVKFGNRF